MPEQEEVNLIDLLIVIIRYRKVIIGATVLSALTAAAIFFILPSFGIISFGTYTVKATAVTSQIPPALEKELGLDPEALAVSYAQNLQQVADTAVQTDLLRTFIGDSDGWNFRTFIARSFIGEKYIVNAKDGVISLEVSVRKAKEGKAFLSEMISNIDRQMRAEIGLRSTIIANSMESLKSENLSSAGLSDSVRQLIITSNIYREGKTPALVITSGPEILINSQSRGKNAIIVVGAAFFLSIFLAFALDYVDRIKADPESSAKIRKALGK